MKSRWMPAIALRIAIYWVIVPLAFVAVVPDPFETIHWWLTPELLAKDEPVAQIAPSVPVAPPVPLPPSRPQPVLQSAPPPFHPTHAQLVQTQHMQDLFDRGRMHELYAEEALIYSALLPAKDGGLAHHARKCLMQRERVRTCAGLATADQFPDGIDQPFPEFSDAAKAQVPEDVFVAQASRVLERVGPRVLDGRLAADWMPAWLKGAFNGRGIVSWIPHPETSSLDVESERFGTLADSHEQLTLDLSGGRVKLAMFSEASERLPAASIWLPRTCRNAEEDPLQQCHLRAAMATASDAIVIPTPGKVWVSTAVAIDRDGHAQIAAVGQGGWLLMASCRTTPCRGDAALGH